MTDLMTVDSNIQETPPMPTKIGGRWTMASSKI